MIMVWLYFVDFYDGLVIGGSLVWQRLLCTKGAWGFLQSAGAGGGEGPSEPKLRRGGEKLNVFNFFSVQYIFYIYSILEAKSWNYEQIFNINLSNNITIKYSQSHIIQVY